MKRKVEEDRLGLLSASPRDDQGLRKVRQRVPRGLVVDFFGRAWQVQRFL